ncbi:hypothetical protein FSP39_009160, partial [Pinctada imbricata]
FKEYFNDLVYSILSGDQVDDLDKLQKDFSEWRLERAPEYATTIGIHRYNDILENFKWQRFDTDKEKTESFLSGLQRIDYNSLDELNKAGYDVFNDTLHTFLQGYKWKDYNAMNPVSFLEGPHTDPQGFTDSAPFYTYGDYVNFLSRIQKLPQQIEDMIGRMNRSITFRHTYYNTAVLEVPNQIDGILTDRPEDFPFYKPFTEKLQNNTNIEDSLKITLRNDAKTAIQNVLSKFRALKTYMSQVYQRNTRSQPGVNSWDKGEEYYRDCLRWHLSLDMSPEEVHQKGLEEVSRISGKMNTIMKRLNHQGSVKQFFDNIKSDSRFFLNTSEQVLNRFNDIVHRQIEPTLPQLFKDLPNLPVVVTIDFMALSLHETSPGHHLQGWALYSEALGEELNLYKDDYEFWSRQHAIQYMLNYTAYNEEAMTNEIDRYLVWPGQACAYKIGELKIRELRTKAEKELGTNFDIKDFHSAVLKNGALQLNILERIVNQWIQSVKESASTNPATNTCKGGTSAAESTSANVLHLFLGIIWFLLVR